MTIVQHLSNTVEEGVIADVKTFFFYLELCLKYLKHICFQIYHNEFHQELTMSHLWQQIASKLSYH